MNSNEEQVTLAIQVEAGCAQKSVSGPYLKLLLQLKALYHKRKEVKHGLVKAGTWCFTNRGPCCASTQQSVYCIHVFWGTKFE